MSQALRYIRSESSTIVEPQQVDRFDQGQSVDDNGVEECREHQPQARHLAEVLEYHPGDGFDAGVHEDIRVNAGHLQQEVKPSHLPLAGTPNIYLAILVQAARG